MKKLLATTLLAFVAFSTHAEEAATGSAISARSEEPLNRTTFALDIIGAAGQMVHDAVTNGSEREIERLVGSNNTTAYRHRIAQRAGGWNEYTDGTCEATYTSMQGRDIAMTYVCRNAAGNALQTFDVTATVESFYRGAIEDEVTFDDRITPSNEELMLKPREGLTFTQWVVFPQYKGGFNLAVTIKIPSAA